MKNKQRLEKGRNLVAEVGISVGFAYNFVSFGYHSWYEQKTLNKSFAT